MFAKNAMKCTEKKMKNSKGETVMSGEDIVSIKEHLKGIDSRLSKIEKYQRDTNGKVSKAFKELALMQQNYNTCPARQDFDNWFNKRRNLGLEFSHLIVVIASSLVTALLTVVGMIFFQG